MAKITFSQEVKEELCEVKFNHDEAVAELAAMVLFGENVVENRITLRTEHASIAARIQLIFRKAIDEDVAIDIVKGRRNYSVNVSSEILEKAGVFFYEDGDIALDEDVYENESNKRAFLRGAFLVSGTISQPEKSYSCELVTYNENMSNLAAEILEDFGIKANTVKRNNSYVTYLKDKNSVNDFLNIVGAHKIMLDFMVAQIEKDVHNRDNRTTNCQTANLDRTIAAAVFQTQAIMKLKDRQVWNTLDEQTKKLAEVRLEYFDLSLAALGEKMDPPMTKSSVNRRIKKLIELAEDI